MPKGLKQSVFMRNKFWYKVPAMNNSKPSKKEAIAIIFVWLFALSLVYMVYLKIKAVMHW